MKINLLDKFNSLNVQARYTIFGVALFLIFLFDYLLIMNFQLGFIRKNKEQIQTLKADIARVDADKQRINQIKTGIEQTQAQFNSMNVKVRTTQEVPAILQEISQMASAVGLTIDQILPQKQAQEVLLKAPEGDYHLLPIMVQAHSGYHTLGRFLDRLENSNLYFLIKDFRIENVSEKKDLSITLGLKIILFSKAEKK